MSVDINPLVSPPPKEIPLRNAPLVRVIAQVRFPVIASIEKREFIASFQEVLRDTYPVLRQEKTQGVVLGPQGVASTQSEVVWRFRDLDEQWRLSLAPEFIALETRSYTSRNDFLQRFQRALDGVVEHIGPKIVDRIGLRYIDRIAGPDLDDINKLVRSEMVGILATPMALQAEQSVHEALLNVPESNAKLRARWGQVPPNSTVDPAAIEPQDTPSWLLDLDMFSTKPQAFDTASLMMHAQAYAERIYTLFRWAVTDAFLRRYGGEL